MNRQAKILEDTLFFMHMTEADRIERMIFLKEKERNWLEDEELAALCAPTFDINRVTRCQDVVAWLLIDESKGEDKGPVHNFPRPNITRRRVKLEQGILQVERLVYPEMRELLLHSEKFRQEFRKDIRREIQNAISRRDNKERPSVEGRPRSHGG